MMQLSEPRHWSHYLLWPAWVVLYYVCQLAFALCVAVVNLCAFATALLPQAPWKVAFFQGMIRRMAKLCFWIYDRTGIVRVDLRGFDALPAGRECIKPILVANHPSLLDVFIFYLKVPRLTCIYKDSLRHTLIKAKMGEEIGFISNANTRHMIREAAMKVAAGEQLLIFPEGTRTVAPPVNRFKSGAVAIARKAAVPLQTVVIYVNSNVLSKEQSVFRIPRLPIRFVLEVGERFDPADYSRHQDMNAAMEVYFARRIEEGPRG